MKAERVIAYIDGFSLYFGLKDADWRRYYWLDPRALCSELLRDSQQLVQVKYFTSRIKGFPGKLKRQSTYFEALSTIPGVQLIYGKYQFKPCQCRGCGYVNQVPEGKMTDVQLAVEMLVDALHDSYDTALLITGDIDIAPSIEKTRQAFADKRVVVGFPPRRNTQELRKAANAYIHITEPILRSSLLPDEVTAPGGYVLRRPSEWT